MITYQWSCTLPPENKRIREIVFMQEQGFQHEFDSIDDEALHVVIFVNGTAAGCGRCYPDKNNTDCWHIGRIAILQEFRGQHLGRALLKELEAEITRCGGTKAVLSAQCRARRFYEKSGYCASGTEYTDEGCPHIHMQKGMKS